jgi:hypothetical protein
MTMVSVNYETNAQTSKVQARESKLSKMDRYKK